MRLPRVQLLYFPDCPHVEAARRTLDRALEHITPRPAVEEIDVTDPRTPPELRSWGSPTILVDGMDVLAGEPSENCCRIYPGGAERGAPPIAAIEAALRR